MSQNKFVFIAIEVHQVASYNYLIYLAIAISYIIVCVCVCVCGVYVYIKKKFDLMVSGLQLFSRQKISKYIIFVFK